MKKKLVALLVLMVVSITMIFSATACSAGIFEKDKKRDYYQVIGSVQYKYGTASDEVISKDIYKGQLNSYVYSYGGTYQQNYGMSIESIVEYFYNSLTRNALVTLYAKSKIYELAKAATNDDDPFKYVDTSIALKDADPESFLTFGRRLYAIDKANEEFTSSYQSYLDKKENKDDEEDKEEEDNKEDKDILDPREVRSYAATKNSEYDEKTIAKSVSIIYGVKYKDTTYGDITKEFIEEELNTTIDEFFNKMTFESQVKAKIAAEKDKIKKANMKDALKDLQDSVDNAYLSWEYFYDIQFDSEALASYQKYVEDEGIASEEKIQMEYDTQKKSDIKNYMDLTDYASALNDSKWSIVNPANNYIGVKSILLKFSTSQESAVKALSTIFAGNKEVAKEYRDAIAIGVSDDDILPILLKEDELGIKVNVSNPLYDSENDKKEDAYVDKDLNYALVLANMADSIAHITSTIVNKYKDSDEYKALNAEEQAKILPIVEYKAKVEAFTQWIYLVNDDPGMFSSERYIVTPDGEDTSFVEEFTVLGRELTSSGIGATALVNRGTFVSSNTIEYTGNVTAFSSKEYDLYIRQATSNTKSDELKTNIYTLVTKEGQNDISFIVNDYGIHVIMVTDIFGTDTLGVNAVEETIEDKTAYVFGMDSIKSIDCSINYDYVYTVSTEYVADTKYYEFKAGEFVLVDLTEEDFTNDKYYTREWNLISVDCEYKTVKDFFEDQVLGYVYSDAMSVEQIVLYFDAEEGADPKIVKNDKVYDKYLKDLLGK